MNFLNFVLIQLISQSYGFSISYDLFIKNNKINDVSNYAKSNGFPDFDAAFKNFKIKYNKNYTKEEEEKRKYYFMNTLIAIVKNKQQLQNGEVHHELAINKFADLLPEEKLMMGNNWSKHSSSNSTQHLDENDLDVDNDIDVTQSLPRNFDWRDKNVVTEVKNQGKCGSCWAFAGIATLESTLAIKNQLINKELIRLSEQEMVDCVFGYSYDSEGCDGGTVNDVYTYILNNGVAQETDYPYKHRQMTCKSTGGMWKTKINGFFRLEYDTTDNAIMHTIYNKGPVAVIINAGDNEFNSYSKGIMTSYGNQDLEHSKTNHYITVVGWGTENRIDYWIIKNSYGKDWGEDGYFRLKRGINSRAFNSLIIYPTVQPLNNRPFTQSIDLTSVETTESITEETTESINKGTTESITEGTTKSITEGTTKSITEEPTKRITDKHIKPITKKPNDHTIEESNDSMNVKYSLIFNLLLFALLLSYHEFSKK